MRAVLLASFIGLLIPMGSMGCSGSGNDPDAQQLARINKELALLSEQMRALTSRVEQLEARTRKTPDARGSVEAISTRDGTRAGSAPGDDELIVSLTASGAIAIDGSPVSADELGDALREASERPVQLMIRAATETPHGRIVEIMDLAKQSGIDRIAIAPDESE